MNEFLTLALVFTIAPLLTIAFSQWIDYKKMALGPGANLDAELSAYDKGRRDGMEEAAAYLETRFIDRGPLAKAIRTLKEHNTPCEDCGYTLPTHDPSCVSRHGSHP